VLYILSYRGVVFRVPVVWGPSPPFTRSIQWRLALSFCLVKPASIRFIRNRVCCARAHHVAGPKGRGEGPGSCPRAAQARAPLRGAARLQPRPRPRPRRMRPADGRAAAPTRTAEMRVRTKHARKLDTCGRADIGGRTSLMTAPLTHAGRRA
jgi:hypothetical protein